MPFELGLFLGARRYGGRPQRAKACIVLDHDKDRFRRFLSDMAGQDIRSHQGDVDVLIRELTAWFRLQPGGAQPGGGQAIAEEYATFRERLPEICASKKLQESELEFSDFNGFVTVYVAALSESADPVP